MLLRLLFLAASISDEIEGQAIDDGSGSPPSATTDKLREDLDVLRSENNIKIGDNRDDIAQIKDNIASMQTEIRKSMADMKRQLDRVS